MTTYVLGAGASLHAGYPLCSTLWSQIVLWVIQSHDPGSEYRRVVDTIATLHGPIADVEEMFTNLDLAHGVFQTLSEDQRSNLKGALSRCLSDYFKSVCAQHLEAPLYQALAEIVRPGDYIITFNYDVALENELIAVQKFRAKNGYGKSLQAVWDEPDSDVTMLKLHGSINWIAVLFGGVTEGYGAFRNSLGQRPFVDNVESVFPAYPPRILDTSFPGGGVSGGGTSLVLPTYEKRYSVATSVGDEWGPFYESLWAEAADALERSDRIVVIGYSMPNADRRSRALLLWGRNKRADVLLCCAGSNALLKRAFEDHGYWRVLEAGMFSDFCHGGLPPFPLP